MARAKLVRTKKGGKMVRMPPKGGGFVIGRQRPPWGGAWGVLSSVSNFAYDQRGRGDIKGCYKSGMSVQ